jgi:hypothetical protein
VTGKGEAGREVAKRTTVTGERNRRKREQEGGMLVDPLCRWESGQSKEGGVESKRGAREGENGEQEKTGRLTRKRDETRNEETLLRVTRGTRATSVSIVGESVGWRNSLVEFLRKKQL